MGTQEDPARHKKKKSHISVFSLKLMFKALWLVQSQFTLLSVQIPDKFQKFYFSSTERVYSNVTVPQDFDLQLEHAKNFSFASRF